jgi:hypothetical protein
VPALGLAQDENQASLRKLKRGSYQQTPPPEGIPFTPKTFSKYIHIKRKQLSFD